MKFEFVDFFPGRLEGSDRVLGTCHIYLIDIQMDLRGIIVAKDKGKFFFRIPHKKGKCHETGKIIPYPCISFTDQKTNKEILDFLHKEASPLILKRLKEERKIEEKTQK